MNDQASTPDSTAVRVALWRALHVQLDAAPHVLEDELGLRLAAPEEGWRNRPDMDPEGTRTFRASIVARARFIEDLLVQEVSRGITQYVLLGAGLDTFAQRRPELASRMRVFEIDKPGAQAWKQQRLIELGFGIPDWLRFVPVNFEADASSASWRERLVAAGFDVSKPAVVASTGVSMYLTREANMETLREVARLAAGTTFVMSFLVPFELAHAGAQQGFKQAAKGAQASGTPFISFYKPDELLKLAAEAGFRNTQHVSPSDLTLRYFANRTDGLRPPDHAEEILVAST